MKYTDVKEILKSNVIGIELIADTEEKPALQILSINNITKEIASGTISLTTGFGIHNANEFLRSLESGLNVEFKSFKQYNRLILNINAMLTKRRNVQYA